MACFLLVGIVFALPLVCCVAQAEAVPKSTSEWGEIAVGALSFIYSLAHLIGQGIVRLIDTILPSMSVPTDLVDPIGLLAILTIFLAIASIAKRLVWIVVIAGWVLILIRLALVIVQHYV